MGELLRDIWVETQDSSSPATVPILLRALHMNTASAQTQLTVLKAWLQDHEPSQPLRLSLRENGFGVLLGSSRKADSRRN
jgi:hypothetical protein